MLTEIFDTHAHYASRQFDSDRKELLDSLPQKGVVGICQCATHSGDAPACLELAEAYPYIWAAVGIHPESLVEEDAPTVTRYHGDWQAELRDMEPLFAHPKVVAVGEIGLDHHWDIPAHAQYDLFEAQLRLARELDKPVIIHDRQAHGEIYELIRKYKPKGILHCFSGSAEDAAWLTQQGMYIGFGGALTFQGAKRAVKAAAAVPLDKLLLETDCPYMAPVPCRGQRCDSSLIAHVAAFLGELRQMDPQEICHITHANARRVFGLE